VTIIGDKSERALQALDESSTCSGRKRDREMGLIYPGAKSREERRALYIRIRT
jgi:hypothetical protein